MKKNVKRTIALILTLVLAFSCIGAGAFAATADTVKQYGKNGGYLAFGDSICRGCGAKGYYYDPNQYNTYDMRDVDGSFPYEIAQAVGCTAPMDISDKNGNYWPVCYPGMTLSATMDLLGVDDNFTDTDLKYGWYNEMIARFGYSGSFDGVKGEKYNGTATVGNIDTLIKDSSLITVELGMCDVFYRALVIATNGGSFAGGFDINTASAKDIAAFVKTFISEMNKGYLYWKTYYPVFLKTLQKMNPKATIVMVGSYDMVQDLTLTDKTLLPIGTAAAAITAAMNRQYSKWAKQYNVLYADITNTESLGTEEDWSFLGKFSASNESALLGSHPSQAGHLYIARQILSVLPEKTASDATTNPTDIVVDLGRFQKVDYVMVNGVNVDNYSMNGYTITIPYGSELAVNLTVGIVGEDGKVAVQTYDLKYDNGYTAYRVYGTNDAAGSLEKPISNTVTIGQKLISSIKGLFSK